MTKDFNIIIKQCLQRKPENRATIDELIFSEDFQNKAKINKITLPRHLNKHKILSSLQTRKSLEPDEVKLILDLVRRGHLPKSLENDPVIVHSLMADEQNSTVIKQHSHDLYEAAKDDGINSLNAYPDAPRMHHTRSSKDSSGSISAFSK